MNRQVIRFSIAAVTAAFFVLLVGGCGGSQADDAAWSTIYAEENTLRGITRSAPIDLPGGQIRVQVQVVGTSAEEIGSGYRLVMVGAAPDAPRIVRLIATAVPTPLRPGVWRGEFRSEESVPAGRYRLVYRARSTGPMEVAVFVRGSLE